jgi:hypothetical protein
MTMKPNPLILCISLIAAVAFPRTVQAALIVGGSSLLSQSDANQLESWLGEGPITLNNIFTKTTGDGQDSYDFHAAADGQGRTFVVMEVLTTYGNSYQIIGGYNPQSWDNSGSYHYTSTDAERTAFLFNLTTATLQAQQLNSSPSASAGPYQTFNRLDYGPTFGGGHDIYSDTTLSAGYAQQYTYGGPGILGLNIIGKPFQGSPSINYGSIEVFTIMNTPTSAVPEPTTALLWLVGGMVCWRYRARKNPPTHKSFGATQG